MTPEREPARVVRRRLAAVRKGLEDYLRIAPNEGEVERAAVRQEMLILLDLATGALEPVDEVTGGAMVREA